MRLAAAKPAAISLAAERQPIPIPTCSSGCKQAKTKKSRSDRGPWRVAVASSDAEADGADARSARAGRRARLSARRRERVLLPDGVSGVAVGEFPRHPDSVESLLNTGALESFAPAGTGPGTFTCALRRIGLLGFEVAPVLDLRVAPRSTDCTIEMLSCRFEGSEALEQQNELFSRPRSSWHIRRRDFASAILLPFLIPRINISIAAEIYDASIIRSGVRNVLTKAKAAGVLRLVFHDAGTFEIGDKSGGMNGSIIYEVDRPENTGLNRSIKILRKAKEGIDNFQKVSWADLIAVAGAEAVALCGGPEIPVRLGRLDSSTADPTGKLPEETLDATSLKILFSKKGFSAQEMVVLSGAHTIGGKGFGSPIVFDNTYYKVLLEKPQTSSTNMAAMVGLRTDWALTEDDECLRWIKVYAGDQARFFDDFRDAYIKLVDSGASWRTT